MYMYMERLTQILSTFSAILILLLVIKGNVFCCFGETGDLIDFATERSDINEGSFIDCYKAAVGQSTFFFPRERQIKYLGRRVHQLLRFSGFTLITHQM